jgi:hypothetical protein
MDLALGYLFYFVLHLVTFALASLFLVRCFTLVACWWHIEHRYWLVAIGKHIFLHRRCHFRQCGRLSRGFVHRQVLCGRLPCISTNKDCFTWSFDAMKSTSTFTCLHAVSQIWMTKHLIVTCSFSHTPFHSLHDNKQAFRSASRERIILISINHSVAKSV